MKLSIQQTLVMLVTSVFAFAANAHPGHDHSAWSSPAVHAILYVSIAAVVIFAAVLARRAITKKSNKAEK